MSPATTTPPPAWDGTSKGGSRGNRAFMFLIRHFGVLPAYALLLPVSLTYALHDRKAATAVRDLRRRLGLRTSGLDLWRHFAAFGISLIDRLAFLARGKVPFKYTSDHEDLITDVLKEGKGVILLSAHVGNWELAGNLLRDRINTPINIVARDNEREQVREALDEAMRNRRLKVIALSEHGTDVTIQILNALRAGEIVCLHGDRLVEQQQSEALDFLGAPARLPIGPFAIAAIAGCPIIPIFVIRTGWMHYTFRAHQPIRLGIVDRAHRREAIRRAMQHYVDVLSEVVRGAPSEWHNFYDFWASGTGLGES